MCWAVARRLAAAMPSRALDDSGFDEFDGSMAGTPDSQSEHPMDVVYDIVAGLSRKEQDNAGWVDLDNILPHAATRRLTKENVEEPTENCECFRVIVRDSAAQKLKVLVPPVG